MRAFLPRVLRDALLILALMLLVLAGLALFGDDARMLPFSYEGHDPG